MKSYGSSWAIPAFLLMLILPTSASATTIRSFTTAELVHEAALIVRGKVVTQQSRWKHDKSAIYTDSTVQITAIIAGRTTHKTIAVRQLGGRIDGMEMSVVGTARINVGEDVLLFLRTNGKHHFLVGMAQGKYAVQKQDGRTIATRNLIGLMPVHKMQRIGSQRVHKHGRDSISLDTFIAQIRAIANTPKVTP